MLDYTRYFRLENKQIRKIEFTLCLYYSDLVSLLCEDLVLIKDHTLKVDRVQVLTYVEKHIRLNDYGSHMNNMNDYIFIFDVVE